LKVEKGTAARKTPSHHAWVEKSKKRKEPMWRTEENGARGKKRETNGCGGTRSELPKKKTHNKERKHKAARLAEKKECHGIADQEDYKREPGAARPLRQK